MKISAKVAEEIVEQLSLDLNQGINIMDRDGVILASSDKTRVGMPHAGAKKLLDENLPNLIVEDNHQYSGSKCGVNLPIVIDGEVLGVIGITGAVSEVFKFGNIIKRMTELLLLDRKIRDQEVIERKARDRFFDEWVLGQLEEYNPTEFCRMAETLGINTDLAYRVAVLSVKTDLPPNDTTLTELSGYIRRFLKNTLGANTFRTATKMVCLFEESVVKEFPKAALMLSEEVNRLFGFKTYIGIDNTSSRLHLRAGFDRADAALSMAVKRGDAFVYYDELDLDFILDGVSEAVCDRYMNRLFQNASDSEIRSHMAFVEAYLSCNGSLTDVSEKLFIHKNTVKYKINRLKEATGVDIRTCDVCYIFSLGSRLCKAVKTSLV